MNCVEIPRIFNPRYPTYQLLTTILFNINKKIEGARA